MLTFKVKEKKHEARTVEWTHTTLWGYLHIANQNIAFWTGKNMCVYVLMAYVDVHNVVEQLCQKLEGIQQHDAHNIT